MKLSDSKSKTRGIPAIVKESDVSPERNVRRNYIATAAYYKAQVRGFTPGHELDDWLEAEAGFDELTEH